MVGRNSGVTLSSLIQDTTSVIFHAGLRGYFYVISRAQYEKIVNKFPHTPLTLEIANLRSNFISNISQVFRRFSYVV